jgi:S1/P1 Nuclease
VYTRSFRQAMRRSLLTLLGIFALTVPLGAWNAAGHMTVAYIAYQKLEPPIRERVDTLLKRNPQYAKWTDGVPAAQKSLVAFLNASMWPDCIKGDSCPGYVLDGPENGNKPPADPTASRNIGYADHLMHKYWHFVDLPYAPSGLPSVPPPGINAEEEMVKFRAVLRGTASDDIKSYDVVWLEHLVGDVHQPLHDISRFTALHPGGDAGGNLVRFCTAPCDSPENLHAYWDGLMGEQSDLATIRMLAEGLLAQPEPAGARNDNISAWIKFNWEMAKEFVYTAPISKEDNPQIKLSPRPNAAYDIQAHKVARQQILLAGYRLAYLLNQNLK